MFQSQKHVGYLVSLDKESTSSMSSFRAESIRMGGVYWGFTALSLLGVSIPDEKKSKLSAFIESCFDEDKGGYGWSSGHDAHITATHYAVLVLKQLDVAIPPDRCLKIVDFVKDQQRSDGSFQCDEWGETDLRFVLNAVSILSLLEPDQWTSRIDAEALVKFILSCQNESDGGFGPNPDLESHAAYTFCAVGALRILGVDVPKSSQLARWLCERQTPCGGLNGRPEKAPDVCYSWWIVSSLEMLGKRHWVDVGKLAEFILKSQEPSNGGIADRPECVPDVFHTLFGIAGLSLIDHTRFGLEPVDPRYCIPMKSL